MIKKILIGGGIVAALGVAAFFIMINLPARDVQATEADLSLDATELVKEFIENTDVANQKYLSEDGDSKILIIKGRVHSVTKDGAGLQVVYLKSEEAKMGVSCTFLLETNEQAEALEIGSEVLIKGVIRAGAGYDEDLEMYDDVIVEKCAIVQK